MGRLEAVAEEAARTGARTVDMVGHGVAVRMWVTARAGNVDVAYASRHALSDTGVVVLPDSLE